MLRPLSRLSALTLLFFSLACSAQESATAAAGDPAGIPPDAEIRKFRDWNVQCVRNAQTDASQCTLFQHLNVDSGQRLLTMQVNQLTAAEGEPGTLAVVVTVPLGVHLPSGMRMQVDDGTPLDLTYERCDQGGCYAGTLLGGELLEALVAGSKSRVTFNNLRGESITATLSLNGFTAGYQAMEAN